MKVQHCLRFLVFIFFAVLVCAAKPTISLANPANSLPHFILLKADKDFSHDTGRQSRMGWELDHNRDKPGLALNHMTAPLFLQPTVYRMTVLLRRGNYPAKGLLMPAVPVVRLEIWDRTDNRLLNERELQRDDFSGPNAFEDRWVEFSLVGREGHVIEPQIFWYGLTNAEIKNIRFLPFPTVSKETLEGKARRLQARLESQFLENGFVVSRKKSGEPEDLGDAATYTGYYTAALAWKYAVTKNPGDLADLENTLQHLHGLLKGSQDQPLLTRFIDSEGTPFPASPSKDVYSSFFFAYAAAMPWVKDDSLKKDMKDDLSRILTPLWDNDLTVRSGPNEIFSLAPYITTDEVRFGIHKMLTDQEEYVSFLRALKKARSLTPWSSLWPNLNEVMKAVRRRDETRLMALIVPSLRDVLQILERARDILKEEHREDLLPKRAINPNLPGKRLERTVNELTLKIKNFRKDGTIQYLSDLRVLGGNAILALHLAKTGAVLTDRHDFDDAYRKNLTDNLSLQKTAVDWFGVEEILMNASIGTAAADLERRGILAAMALYNLIQLEKDSSVKDRYKDIAERWWNTCRNEDNPLANAMAYVMLEKKAGDIGIILRDLDQYPENPEGFGEGHWISKGDLIGDSMGAGVHKGYSREPLPIPLRPRDPFLWQRNPRRLRGDDDRLVPGTDYLFLYWFCRYHQLF